MTLEERLINAENSIVGMLTTLHSIPTDGSKTKTNDEISAVIKEIFNETDDIKKRLKQIENHIKITKHLLDAAQRI